MPLYHTDDQAMLADSATSFMAEEGNITKQLRHWRDRDCKDGFGHGCLSAASLAQAGAYPLTGQLLKVEARRHKSTEVRKETAKHLWLRVLPKTRMAGGHSAATNFVLCKRGANFSLD